MHRWEEVRGCPAVLFIFACIYIIKYTNDNFHITVSIVELAKVWRDAFDASTAQAAPTPVRAPRERKQEIDSVYVGGGCVWCL